jgi:hypothetical protein
MECFNYPYMSMIGTVLLQMRTLYIIAQQRRHLSPFGYMYMCMQQ